MAMDAKDAFGCLLIVGDEQSLMSLLQNIGLDSSYGVLAASLLPVHQLISNDFNCYGWTSKPEQNVQHGTRFQREHSRTCQLNCKSYTIPSPAPLTTTQEPSAKEAGAVVQPLLLRPPDIAIVLGISESKVYEMLRAGELPSVRIGRSVRVPAAALAEWVRQQRDC